MKDRKVTLTLGQLKKLVKESIGDDEYGCDPESAKEFFSYLKDVFKGMSRRHCNRLQNAIEQTIADYIYKNDLPDTEDAAPARSFTLR